MRVHQRACGGQGWRRVFPPLILTFRWDGLSGCLVRASAASLRPLRSHPPSSLLWLQVHAGNPKSHPIACHRSDSSALRFLLLLSCARVHMRARTQLWREGTERGNIVHIHIGGREGGISCSSGWPYTPSLGNRHTYGSPPASASIM